MVFLWFSYGFPMVFWGWMGAISPGTAQGAGGACGSPGGAAGEVRSTEDR